MAYDAEVNAIMFQLVMSGEFNKAVEEALITISDEIRDLFKDAIQRAVYDYYTPKRYDRHGDILTNQDAFTITQEKGHMSVVINTDIFNYYSAVDKSRDVSNLVWGFMASNKNKNGQTGHDDNKGKRRRGYNQYHRYEKRKYLELAKDLIESEYEGVKVEIINVID
jgi:hypothetical protein